MGGSGGRGGVTGWRGVPPRTHPVPTPYPPPYSPRTRPAPTPVLTPVLTPYTPPYSPRTHPVPTPVLTPYSPVLIALAPPWRHGAIRVYCFGPVLPIKLLRRTSSCNSSLMLLVHTVAPFGLCLFLFKVGLKARPPDDTENGSGGWGAHSSHTCCITVAIRFRVVSSCQSYNIALESYNERPKQRLAYCCITHPQH